jgi:hypothetical protein
MDFDFATNIQRKQFNYIPIRKTMLHGLQSLWVYPEPELHNPKRGIDINKSEQCKEYEHK